MAGLGKPSLYREKNRQKNKNESVPTLVHGCGDRNGVPLRALFSRRADGRATRSDYEFGASRGAELQAERRGQPDAQSQPDVFAADQFGGDYQQSAAFVGNAESKGDVR